MAEENTNNFSFTNIFQGRNANTNTNSSTINDNQALKVFNGDFSDLKTCQMVIKEQKAVIEACMKEIEYLKSTSNNSTNSTNISNNVNNNAKIDRALEIIKILKKPTNNHSETDQVTYLKKQNKKYKNIIGLLLKKQKEESLKEKRKI